MSSDRRSAPRVPLNPNRPLRAEIPDGDYLVPSAVVPYDLSLTGIRGRWERSLPERYEFDIYLELTKPVRFRARVAWQRILPGNTAVAGLRFMNVSKRSATALRAYMKGLQATSRRSSERVEDLLPVEVIMPNGEESFSAIASDVSRDGLQITNDFELPANITVLLPLSWEPPLELAAQLRWQRETVFGGYVAGYQFIDPPDEAQLRLDEYVTALAAATELAEEVATNQ